MREVNIVISSDGKGENWLERNMGETSEFREIFYVLISVVAKWVCTHVNVYWSVCFRSV